jgi:dTDP-4-dehydrorhamnose reductase
MSNDKFLKTKKKNTRILLTGGTGQVGYELKLHLSHLFTVWAPKRSEFDLSNLKTIREKIKIYKPDLIINTAAFTNVEQAETQPGLARIINAYAPKVMAEEAKKLDIILIHLSTDYVFDGKNRIPYCELDKPNPLNVYGKTKLEGEKYIKRSHDKYLIFRTGWVYSPKRGKNFYQTISKLLKQKKKINVVNNQIGSPTSVKFLSKNIIQIIKQLNLKRRNEKRWGLYHLTESEPMSWYQFALMIYKKQGYDINMIEKRIIPIDSKIYPSLINRPKFSVLNTNLINYNFSLNLKNLNI